MLIFVWPVTHLVKAMYFENLDGKFYFISIIVLSFLKEKILVGNSYLVITDNFFDYEKE